MKILALEFSSSQRSVAVVETAGATSRNVAEALAAGSNAAGALALVDEALRQAGRQREEIECLAVGLGPGSYTGIRAAIALAQGWQLARSVKMLGVSSADSLAAQAQAEGISGTINVVIDAQRNEFYLARYELGGARWNQKEGLRLATREEVEASARTGQILIGPEVTRWFAAGRVIFPRAATVGRLAQQRDDFVSGEKLQPIYLRETSFVKARSPRAVL